MSAIVSKHEPRNGLRALIDELYARTGDQGKVFKSTLYSVVLRPGDTTGAPNVFKSWSALYAATAAIQGGVRVTCDDSLGAIVVPPGNYAIDGWQLVNGNGFAVVTIADGAHATWRNLWIDGLSVVFNGATDFQSIASGGTNLYMTDGSSLQCTSTGHFLSSTGTAFAFVSSQAACGVGDGTHVVFSASAGGTLEIFAIEGNYAKNALLGTGGTASINFNQGTFLNCPSYTNVKLIPGTDRLDLVVHFGAIGDGVADDTAALQFAIDFVAGTGKTLVIPGPNATTAGLFNIASGPLSVPINKAIEIDGYGATLNFTGAGSGGPTTAGFLLLPTIASHTTLNGSNTFGSRTISLNAAPAVGQDFFVNATPGNDGHGLTYTCLGVSGPGPFTVTVDRPILQVWAGGTDVWVLTGRPKDVVIRGLTLAGGATNARIYDVQCGLGCKLIDCNITQLSPGYTVPVNDPVLSIDEGSFDCWFIRCRSDFPSNPFCLGSESSENCGALECYQKSSGLFIADCVNFQVTNGEEVGSTTDFGTGEGGGIYIGTNGNYHSYACKVWGLMALGGREACVEIDAAIATELHGVTASFNDTTVAVLVTANATDTEFHGLRIDWGTGVAPGPAVLNQGIRTKFFGLRYSNTPAGDTSFASYQDCYVSGLAFDNGANGFVINFGGTLTVDGFDVTPFGASAAFGAAAGTTTKLVNGVCAFANANSTFVSDQAGGNVWIVDNVDMVGANLATAIGFQATVAGSTFRIGPGVRNKAATPYSFVGGTFQNRKATVAAAPGGTAVAWPDLNEGDDVVLLPTAAVFTGWVSAFTPGTGFTVTDAASGTYEYLIQ